MPRARRGRGASAPLLLDDGEDRLAVFGATVDLAAVHAGILDYDPVDYFRMFDGAVVLIRIFIDDLVHEVLGEFVVRHHRDRYLRRCFGLDVGFFFGKPLVERFAFLLFALCGAEFVGFAPSFGRIDNFVAVVVAYFVRVETLARAEGVAGNTRAGRPRNDVGVWQNERKCRTRAGPASS